MRKDNKKITINNNTHPFALKISWLYYEENGVPLIVYTLYPTKMLKELDKRGLIPKFLRHLILNEQL